MCKFRDVQVTEGGDTLVYASDDAGRLAQLSGPMQTNLRYDGRSFLALSEAETNLIFEDGFEDGNASCWSSVVGGSAGGTCTAPPIPEPSVTEPIYSTEGVVHAFVNTEDANQRARTQFYFAGRPVAQLEVSSGGGDVWTFLIADHHSTPAASTDLSGAMVWLGGFESFGVDWQAGTPDGASETGVQLRLSGQWADDTWAGSQLSYNVFRWYENATGRYTRVDPVNLGMLENAGRTADLPISALDAYFLAILRTGNPQFEQSYGYPAQNALLFEDPLGLFGPAALAQAGGACIAVDGPLPVGDAVGVPLLAISGVWAIGITVVDTWDNGKKCDDCSRGDREERCLVQYNADVAECQRRHSVRKPGMRSACYGSASNRYGNCLAGRPLGPLSP